LENCSSVESLKATKFISDLKLDEDSLRTAIRIELETKNELTIKASKKSKINRHYRIANTRALKKARKIAKEKQKQEKLLKKETLRKQKEHTAKLKTVRAILEQEIQEEINENKK